MPARRSSTPSGTPATVALRQLGVEFRVHEFAHDRNADSFGLEAAAALGVAADRVFKTLVVQTDRPKDNGLVVAVVPVDRQLDLKALARETGCKRAVLADPALAQRTTGYVVGGISPIGQKRSLLTVVDASAAGHVTILVSGGRRGLDVDLAPADLVRVTGARVAAIVR